MPVLQYAVGFDVDLVERLSPDEARFFSIASLAAFSACVLVGVGMTFGAGVALELWPLAGLVGLAGTLMALNLFRLIHSGTGFPLHEPISRLDAWRPPPTGALVLSVLGAMLLQPIVLLALGDVGSGGLIHLGHAAWGRPLLAGVLTLALALLMSAASWLRFFYLTALRAYERERWHANRAQVDHDWAAAQEVIATQLAPYPSFTGPLRVHFADPPYNTLPLPFGIDPARVERDRVKFVPPPDEPEQDDVLLPASEPPHAHKPAEPLPAEQTPPKLPPRQPDQDELFPPEDPAVDNSTEAPRAAYFEIGRISAARAREHVDEVAPFISSLTGRDEDEVRALIRVSPDDLQLFRLFSEWKEPGVVMLKTSHFARQHGLARVVAMIVERPLAEVVHRIDDAPPGKKLSSVFAPELAKKLLGKDISHLR